MCFTGWIEQGAPPRTKLALGAKMISTKSFHSRTAGLLVAVAATTFGPASAVAQSADCTQLAGSYITTVTDIEGVFASRGILTLTAGGSVIVTDSRQGGQAGVYAPFTMGQGAWTCTASEEGAVGFKAFSLTFTAPADRAGASLGRVDYDGTLDAETGNVTGTLALRLSNARDLEGAEPLANPGAVVETFAFEGDRIAAP